MALLKVRFGQPQKIIDAHMYALVHIPKPVNTLSSLRLFHDTVESHIRGLKSLEQAENSYGALLVPIVKDKLPPVVRRNLARAHPDPQWTITDLQEGILAELRVLESGESLDYTHESDSPLSTMMTTSLHSGASKFKPRNQHPKPAKCAYCNSPDHSSFVCITITDPRRRMDIVRKTIYVSIVWVATELPSTNQRHDASIAEGNTTLPCVRP